MRKTKLKGPHLRHFIRDFKKSELTPSQAKVKFSELFAKSMFRLEDGILCYESETEGTLFTTSDGILNLHDSGVHFFSNKNV